MDIWKIDKWKEYYSDKQMRGGIKIDFDSGVDETVKNAIKKLVAWLRKEYEFPVRVRIYVKKDVKVKARDGALVPDLFFWPYNRDEEPYIKFATGDYPALLERYEKDDALGVILSALLRELTHYFQWLNNVELTPMGEQRQATRYAKIRWNEYAQTLM